MPVAGRAPLESSRPGRFRYTMVTVASYPPRDRSLHNGLPIRWAPAMRSRSVTDGHSRPDGIAMSHSELVPERVTRADQRSARCGHDDQDASGSADPLRFTD